MSSDRLEKQRETEMGRDVGPAKRVGPTETCFVCKREFPANSGYVGEIDVCEPCLDLD